MKKELKSGILSADKSADCRQTVGGVNVIAVRPITATAFAFTSVNKLIHSQLLAVEGKRLTAKTGLSIISVLFNCPFD